ncbi:hypothetical protein A4A49_05154 [Nicotiana attenuata]|uniref:DUF4283 domain-containing protein n=1 Tax=Nicotiana attenuata TaxID=49451 RepID=A0A1J6I0V8_NICAT|nr:hypothetical protein A4A49_05154 [Nicotiana attenuata]
MDPPDGAPPARLDGHNAPHQSTKQSMEAVTTKTSYAGAISAAKQAPESSKQQTRESVIATDTTHNGMSAVLFKAAGYYRIMAEECRLTIVGRFLKPRPQIDRLRSRFKELITIKGSAKIGVYDNFNVFLDLTNEDDFNVVWYKRVIEIEGQQMWLQRWSPDFKPEEDLPVAPVWVLLPGLPYHMHTWHYVKQVVSVIGTPLEMDLATRGKTRPCMAKVRTEIDLLKQQPDVVYVGQVFDNAPQKGFIQKLEYEGVPKYCKHCRKLGHNMMNCRVLERKREIERKEQQEKQNKNKHDEAEIAENKEANDENEAGETSSYDELKNTLVRQKQGSKQKKMNPDIYANINKEQQDCVYQQRKEPNDSQIMDEAVPIQQSTKNRTSKKKIAKRHSKAEDVLNCSNQMNLNGEFNKEDNIKEGSANVAEHDIPTDSTEPDLNASSIGGKTTKELEWQKYVNESVSIPSEIKNLPGIFLELDLNPEQQQGSSETVSTRMENIQQFEITSPNTVTVVLPENQLQKVQDQDNEEGFSPVTKRKNQNKKKDKKKK